MMHVDQPRATAFARSLFSLADLSRIFWISGSTCAGKTTVSTRVAEQLGWNVYHCDEWERGHGERADPARHPNWYSYAQLTGDALWLQPIEKLCAHDERACDEQFELIAEDLAGILERDDRPLLYDGFVSPKVLFPLLPNPRRAFYLVATDAFQRERYEKRPWIEGVLAKTTDRETAWRNWMERDSRSARALERALVETELSWLQVDGRVAIEETVERVVAQFLSVGT